MDVAIPVEQPVWSVATRVAFRFACVYFSIDVLFTQMLGGLLPIPNGEFPDLGTVAPFRGLVTWTAAHLFRIDHALVITGSGSGDKTFDWVQAFCVLAIAALATVVWSAIDRRTHYTDLHRWFRLFLRFALGSTMLAYGIVKVIPLQMPAPSLARLLEPFGDFSPMGVLWASVGASRAYEMFTGLAEVTAGVLLFIPGLTTLGALVCLADITEVFVLNMTYDVPVKLFSFHLILMALVLLAPDASRLVAALVRSPGARRGFIVAQLVFGAYLLAMNVYNARQIWYRSGGGAPRPALYGVWNVDEMSVDGAARPPLLTDEWRWRRLVVQSTRSITLQQMNGTLSNSAASVDPVRRKLTMANDVATLDYEQPAVNRLVLDGTWLHHRVHVQLQGVGSSQFPLVNRGFHWIQEYPFNR